MLYVWLLVLLVCIIVEFVTMGVTSVWFVGGVLIALLAAALNVPVAIQVSLFLGVSILLLIFTRPIAVKYFNKDRIRTNAESMIGRQAIVISEINNLEGIGQVTVSGMEWSARSMGEDVVIPVGAVVIVRAINGVKLIVEPKQ